MAILLTLLMFLLFISLSYYRSQRREATAAARAPAKPVARPAPVMVREGGFEIPQGYCFHPGHTWALAEDSQIARVGLDGLAADLVGDIEKIDVGPMYRWVRQGQKIFTVSHDGYSVDMLSPVEGVVVAANTNLLRDPKLLTNDPYGEGWVVAVKAPAIESNLNNLLHGSLVRAWMQQTVEHLKEVAAGAGAPVLQDGGMPVRGLLAQVEASLRDRLIHELFLT